MYNKLLEKIKMYYNIAITKYEHHVHTEGKLESDQAFYDLLRSNIKHIFDKLDDFYSEEEAVIAKLKLVQGSFIDELNWEESDRVSLRSTIVNNLMTLPDELDRISKVSKRR